MLGAGLSGSVLREQTLRTGLFGLRRLSRSLNLRIRAPHRTRKVTRQSAIIDNPTAKRSRPEEWRDVMDDDMQADGVLRVARRIYVGNLNWKTTWQDLKDHFAQVGVVKYADILRETGVGGRSKGCGIVEFEAPEEAAAAIQQLNHSELHGRQIFIREDREDFELKGDAARTSGRPHVKRARVAPHGPSGAVAIGRRVWVGNLNYTTTWQMLKDHFKAAGHVMHADIIEDGEGRSKGCGIVEFEAPSDALRAISLLSNSTLDDRQIMVREDREDPGVGAARGGSRSAPPALGGANWAGGNPSGPVPEGTQLVIHGIPFRMAWQELKDLARSCCSGPVVRADIMTNPDGSSKGYGVVAFVSTQDAAAAIQQLNGRVVEGRVLTAKYDRFA